MTNMDAHQQGIGLFKRARYEEALRQFAESLRLGDNSEVWNDWATAQVVCGRAEEAEKGFRLALELSPGNAQAAVNLGGLLFGLKEFDEAARYLKAGLKVEDEVQRLYVEELINACSAKEAPAPHLDPKEVEEFLLRFVQGSRAESAYFNTHLKRYVSTVSFLPHGQPGQRLLELGAAYHFISAAVKRLKGYEDIRCTDIWNGERQCKRTIRSRDRREQYSFLVDNFDVQRGSWPYEDAAFDVVLCCELLEHLHTDPLQMMSEINRVLRTGGVLLLTTPNLASAKSVACLLRGDTPYIYGKFEPSGISTDRHNREYTLGEIERLVRSAGFEVVKIKAENSWWPASRDVFRFLAAAGHPISGREDNILCLARKKFVTVIRESSMNLRERSRSAVLRNSMACRRLQSDLAEKRQKKPVCR